MRDAFRRPAHLATLLFAAIFWFGFLYAAIRDTEPSLWLTAGFLISCGLAVYVWSRENARWVVRTYPRWMRWLNETGYVRFNQVGGVVLIGAGVCVLVAAMLRV